MLRMTVFAVWLLALITAAISPTTAFEMEGTVDRIAAVSARLGGPGLVARYGASGKWSCERPGGTVRLGRLEFCDTPITGPTTKERVAGLLRYRVLVERDLEDQAEGFTARVGSILGGDTGWAGHGIRFVRVVEGFDLTVLLARPATVDRLCRPLRTGGWLSCSIRRRAIINATRWREGAKTWGNDVLGYHHYLINHEVGHVLGLRHARCPETGAPAPIMLPQTRFLKGCTANGNATPRDLAMLTRALHSLKRRMSRSGTKRVKRIRRRKRRARRRYRRRGRSRISRRRRARARARTHWRHAWRRQRER